MSSLDHYSLLIEHWRSVLLCITPALAPDFTWNRLHNLASSPCNTCGTVHFFWLLSSSLTLLAGGGRGLQKIYIITSYTFYCVKKCGTTLCMQDYIGNVATGYGNFRVNFHLKTWYWFFRWNNIYYHGSQESGNKLMFLESVWNWSQCLANR